MVAQLPRGHPDLDRTPEFTFPHLAGSAEPAGPFAPAESAGLSELRAVAAALLARMTDLRERDQPLPDAVFRAAERFQPLLDGVDPQSEDELEELWESALSLPGSLPGPAPRLFVRDGVEDVEPRGT